MPKLSRHPFFTFTILIFAVILLIIFNLTGILKPIKNLAVFVISPIERGISKAGSRIAGTFQFFSQIKNLSSQNKKLEEENKKLLSRNAKLKEVERENELLRRQLDYEKYSERKILPAFVIGFDPYNLLQAVILNRGEKDKVLQNMAVVSSGDILVGQVQKTTYITSEVLLIIDSHATVPAQIQSTRATGLVRGEHGLGLIMEMIPQDQVIKTGDLVITTSLASKFPAGLVIGEIEEIITTESELFQKARIKSPVDFKKLESVYVVLE
jgi:rod shape-determining protein MreC